VTERRPRPDDVGRVETVVDETMLAAAVGSGAVLGLSTPTMIALMERAAVAAIADSLQPGTSSVGTRVDVQHLAPTALGMKVVAEARVVAVDRRRVSFAVFASDDRGPIGEGTHERAIIDSSRFAEALRQRQNGNE